MKFGRGRGDNSFYVMVGTFTLVFLAYLWIGPKVIKKPAGSPPRSGSNEESKQAARVVNGMPPQPVSAGPKTLPASATPGGNRYILGPLPATTTMPMAIANPARQMVRRRISIR